MKGCTIDMIYICDISRGKWKGKQIWNRDEHTHAHERACTHAHTHARPHARTQAQMPKLPRRRKCKMPVALSTLHSFCPSTGPFLSSKPTLIVPRHTTSCAKDIPSSMLLLTISSVSLIYGSDFQQILEAIEIALAGWQVLLIAWMLNCPNNR